MMKYIIFLRAINVGGNRRIKMADLREALTSEGYRNVSTYIQTGNIIAEHEEESYEAIQRNIEHIIKVHLKFDVPAVAFQLEEYERGVRAKAFQGDRLMLHFLDRIPSEDAALRLIELSQGDKDEFKIIDRFLYVSLTEGVSDSLFSNKFVEKTLQVKATARNWNTVMKMNEKSKQ